MTERLCTPIRRRSRRWRRATKDFDALSIDSGAVVGGAVLDRGRGDCDDGCCGLSAQLTEYDPG